jgi:hypothetical protein
LATLLQLLVEFQSKRVVITVLCSRAQPAASRKVAGAFKAGRLSGEPRKLTNQPAGRESLTAESLRRTPRKSDSVIIAPILRVEVELGAVK